MTPREAEKLCCPASTLAALPEAIDNYLAGGDDADGEGAEEEEVLLSKRWSSGARVVCQGEANR